MSHVLTTQLLFIFVFLSVMNFFYVAGNVWDTRVSEIKRERDASSKFVIDRLRYATALLQHCICIFYSIFDLCDR